jgi:predicted  nucleic acid-binding Zn-ribbon protein
MSEIQQTLNALMRLQELDDSSKRQAPPEAVAALRKRLPQPVLAHYDRSRARRRKAVVLMCGNGLCGGCHMRASRGLLSALQRGNEIQVCENCGAYLLLEAPSLTDSSLQSLNPDK